MLLHFKSTNGLFYFYFVLHNSSTESTMNHEHIKMRESVLQETGTHIARENREPNLFGEFGKVEVGSSLWQ